MDAKLIYVFYLLSRPSVTTYAFNTVAIALLCLQQCPDVVQPSARMTLAMEMRLLETNHWAINASGVRSVPIKRFTKE